MGLTERLWKQDKPRGAPDAAMLVARRALIETPDGSEQRLPNYFMDIQTRRNALDRRQLSLMREMYETGADFSTATADAMNTGRIPSMIYEMALLTRGFRLLFVSGLVKPEHLSVRNTLRPDTGHHSFVLDIEPTPAFQHDPSVAATLSPLLPEYNNPAFFPYDQAIIDTIDAHLAGYVEIPASS